MSEETDRRELVREIERKSAEVAGEANPEHKAERVKELTTLGRQYESFNQERDR